MFLFVFNIRRPRLNCNKNLIEWFNGGFYLSYLRTGGPCEGPRGFGPATSTRTTSQLASSPWHNTFTKQLPSCWLLRDRRQRAVQWGNGVLVRSSPPMKRHRQLSFTTGYFRSFFGSHQHGEESCFSDFVARCMVGGFAGGSTTNRLLVYSTTIRPVSYTHLTLPTIYSV